MARTNGQTAEQNSQMRMMNITMPLISLWFCFSMPAAMGLYWIVNSVVMTLQEVILGKFYTKRIQAEEEEREAKREGRPPGPDGGGQKAGRRAEGAGGQEAQEAPSPSSRRTGCPPTRPAGWGDRPYARGRSYQADRYDKKE